MHLAASSPLSAFVARGLLDASEYATRDLAFGLSRGGAIDLT